MCHCDYVQTFIFCGLYDWRKRKRSDVLLYAVHCSYAMFLTFTDFRAYLQRCTTLGTCLNGARLKNRSKRTHRVSIDGIGRRKRWLRPSEESRCRVET